MNNTLAKKRLIVFTSKNIKKSATSSLIINRFVFDEIKILFDEVAEKKYYNFII